MKAVQLSYKNSPILKTFPPREVLDDNLILHSFSVYRVFNKLDAESPTNSSRRSWRKGFDDVWEPSHPSTSLALRHIPAETYERIENVERHLLTPKEHTHKRGRMVEPFAFNTLYLQFRCSMQNRCWYFSPSPCEITYSNKRF